MYNTRSVFGIYQINFLPGDLVSYHNCFRKKYRGKSFELKAEHVIMSCLLRAIAHHKR
jgi:hypothetical protein